MSKLYPQKIFENFCCLEPSMTIFKNSSGATRFGNHWPIKIHFAKGEIEGLCAEWLARAG